ncbi:MAG: transferrin receptor-like dimerization domain-containing protein [Isosphaeraceae bacterium]
MRAAGADVLPLRFTPYGEALREYIDDLRRTVERRARGATPGQSPPPMEFEGLSALVRSVKAFQSAAAEADRATEALSLRDDADPERLARVNANLQRVERAFLMPEGLPGRPWFKHAVYAPGLTTGYASWPLPGVRQAVQDNDAKLLAVQGPRLVQRIDAATQALRAVVSATRSALTPPAEGEARAGGAEPVRTTPAPTRTTRPAVPGAPRTGEPKAPPRPAANPRPAAPATTNPTAEPTVPDGTTNRRDR